MKVSVKKFPVRYNGETYKKGDAFEIEDAHYNEKLFNILQSKKDDGPTKAEIVELLKELEIDFDPKAKKEELAELLDQHSKE